MKEIKTKILEGENRLSKDPLLRDYGDYKVRDAHFSLVNFKLLKNNDPNFQSSIKKVEKPVEKPQSKYKAIFSLNQI